MSLGFRGVCLYCYKFPTMSRGSVTCSRHCAALLAAKNRKGGKK
jgi:hypothetical protein